ncbi:MAG TPA: DUF4190 domain-containing protein [Acidimicrobiia bacterium]|nr:DUF4190 domain-containing protein [Acidimicrobiia bacterium]
MTTQQRDAERWPPPPVGAPRASSPRAAWPASTYQPVPSPAEVTRNGMAVASLVLGLTWLLWAGSILAVVFGHLALRQIAASQGWQRGRGMALSGLILGYCWLALLLLGIVSAAVLG